MGLLILTLVGLALLSWMLSRSWKLASPAVSANDPGGETEARSVDSSPSATAEVPGPVPRGDVPEGRSLLKGEGEGAVPFGSLASLREERLAIHERLKERGDAMLVEIETLFARRGIQDAATVASGWMLAQRRGVYARAIAAAQARIDDPSMRQSLEASQSRILLEEPRAELRTLLGRELEADFLAEIEAVADRFASTVFEVPAVTAGEPSGRGERWKPLDPE